MYANEGARYRARLVNPVPLHGATDDTDARPETGDAEQADAIPYVQLFDFLEPAEMQQLIDHVADHLDQLAPSTVYNPENRDGLLDESTRRSRVGMDTSELEPLFEARLMALLPHVRRELGMERFDFGHLETQLTVHGDGDFFTVHRDENHPDTDGARAVTFVYYFNAEPREFEGGTLRLGAAPSHGHPDDRIEIEPVSNSIVFFAPFVDHEVMPVRATGSGLGSLRCTFNGWFHIGKGTTPVLSRRASTVVQAAVVPRVTDHGFTVRPTPASVQRRLEEFWLAHREHAVSEGPISEYFPSGAPDLLPIGELGAEILNELQAMHEEWAGTALEQVAAYGLRNHRRDQRAPLHVHRGQTHIITSELVVAADLDAPWPLRITLGDRTHDVHVAAGHMVTYEGASCPSGRPDRLQGSSFCTLLLHYRPVGWNLTTADIVRGGVERHLIERSGELDADVAIGTR